MMMHVEYSHHSHHQHSSSNCQKLRTDTCDHHNNVNYIRTVNNTAIHSMIKHIPQNTYNTG